jgi:signal peptidase I
MPEPEPEPNLPPPEPPGDSAPLHGASQPAAPPAPVAPARRAKTAWQVTEHFQFALLALTIALFITTFIVQAFRIPSGSMENTLLVGDYLLVDKTRFGSHNKWNKLLPYSQIRREEIIVFRYPADPEQHFVKRVIGLPGDHIKLWRGRVYVNGSVLQEPYTVFKEHDPDEFRDNFPRGNWFDENVSVAWSSQMRTLVHDGELTVPRDRYFVLGDNRDQSLDSRYWGLVPRENIIGRPMLIYFSLRQPDEDDPVASTLPDDKLFYLRTRIVHFLGDVRWHRILRLAP